MTVVATKRGSTFLSTGTSQLLETDAQKEPILSPHEGLFGQSLTDSYAQAFMNGAGEQGVLLTSLGTIAELSKLLSGYHTACIIDAPHSRIRTSAGSGF